MRGFSKQEPTSHTYESNPTRHHYCHRRYDDYSRSNNAPTKPDTTETKPPAGVAPKLTSTDPDYGYSQKKPIKVGSKDEFGGPAAERAYLSTLRDEAGKPVTFERIGSFGAGPIGNVLDGYEVQTSTGRKLTLYIDMYHPESDPKKQLAPKGLFKAK